MVRVAGFQQSVFFGVIGHLCAKFNCMNAPTRYWYPHSNSLFRDCVKLQKI